MRALPRDPPAYFLRCSLLARKKTAVPAARNVRKNSDFQMRDQGFEPWTP